MIEIREDPNPGGLTSENEESSPLPSTVRNPCPKGLSRRQRKNRRREDLSRLGIPELKKQKTKKISGPSLPKNQAMEPLSQFVEFNGSERVFASFLYSYLMTPGEMFVRGYPTRAGQEQNFVAIYKTDRSTNFPAHGHEIVYGNDCNSNESGQGSESSSDSGDIFDGDDSSSSNSSDQMISPASGINSFMTTCSRCSKTFYITTDYDTTAQKCYHHWGKLQHFNETGYRVYECCQKRTGSVGCTAGPRHVWDGILNGLNGLYCDYVFTKPTRNPSSDDDHSVYALDCEMCYTVKGLEVTKVTVVGMDGRLVYESYVKPDHEIVDYNTRFSGITARDLKRRAIKNIREVQIDLMRFISADTILIGHGLENDLRALKIVHYVVVDTAYAFPHYKGPLYRRSLKNLTSTILKRDIQCGANGHDSYEDARACMELMLWLVRRDFQNLL